MTNLKTDGDFWLLPGDADEDEGLLIWPAGRCPIKEKPIEFREIYCRDLNCICNEIRLIAVDHRDSDASIANVGLKLSEDPEDRSYNLTWSGSFEPADVRSTFMKVLETEPAYYDHLRSMHAMIRRAAKHQVVLHRPTTVC